ncbi:predicted protein [Scheffersomyces stipitis CBS 6054]|uniref:RNA-binding protein VTS1 n=1 Tax=Scheffersomyces stipitis (strain ATCC 58785 / CBS 6054 / NBRC 10063 / NRRL Y-11545) TaxID=322104 RepID=A3LX24_PICST|nr:predicted protein [Scheffersomyces stipitis CBS 6054]ABN67391.2 predicted protein [Scheffersomyces stipitis CBS 6054]KAG2732372.1 hypothetical protein G9P44_004789 [Scheffersomyces stipitis]
MESNESPNPYMSRPIILSPPPLEQHKFANFQSSSASTAASTTPSGSAGSTQQLPVGHAERQQSVGYNLQHEFETLTVDLDLDLRNNRDSNSITSSSRNNTTGGNPSPAAASSTSLGHGHSLLAPAASKHGFSSELLMSSGNSSGLNHPFRENAISPIPAVASANAGIASLLATTSSGNTTNNGNSLLHPPPLASIPNRPQSVNDFSNFFNRQQQLEPQASAPLTSNFYSELMTFTGWIENLNPQDTVSMIDYLCSNLPLDILLTFKSKLDNHLTSHPSQQKGQTAPPYGNIMSPYSSYSQSDLYNDMDQLNLGNEKTLTQPQPTHLYQPKPKQNTYRTAAQYLAFVEQKNPRPKSAEPSLNVNGANRFSAHQQFERAKSPTSHLYEKTNFLQLAAGNSSHNTHSQQQQQPQQQPQQQQQQQQQQGSSQDDSLELNAHTALKLGALATINSRVALDSNRKHVYHQHAGNVSYYQTNASPHYPGQQMKTMAQSLSHEEQINRTLNSSSVPVSIHRNNANSSKSPKSKKSEQKQENLSGINSVVTGSTNMSVSSSLTGSSNSSMPSEVANIELLNNIPAWLKLLRLHKYTDCLKDTPWKELIELDNEQLELKGVAALGARRKLLKAFDAVKLTLEE